MLQYKYTHMTTYTQIQGTIFNSSFKSRFIEKSSTIFYSSRVMYVVVTVGTGILDRHCSFILQNKDRHCSYMQQHGIYFETFTYIFIYYQYSILNIRILLKPDLIPNVYLDGQGYMYEHPFRNISFSWHQVKPYFVFTNLNIYMEGNSRPSSVNLKPLVNKHNRSGINVTFKTTRALGKTKICEQVPGRVNLACFEEKVYRSI